MSKLASFLTALWFAVLAVLALPTAAIAQGQGGGYRNVQTISWVEEWDPAAQRWVRVEEPALLGSAASFQATSTSTISSAPHGAVITETVTTTIITQFAGFVPPQRNPQPAGLAIYGPFRVIDAHRAALVGPTDITSPHHFDAMLRDYPGIGVLEMIDGPGTSHDLANLALGRRIRAAGLDTHVPAHGSVRSGAVELFLAGKRQTIADGATFAVHSWMDERGREPRHFAEDAPENRLYLDYYAEMGMEQQSARAFYAMTNSVPHSGALWLDSATMQRWVAPARPALPQWLVQLAKARKSARELAAAHPALPYGDLELIVLARLDSGFAFP
jgi:hypothetical protein